VRKRAIQTKAPAIPWAALVSRNIGVASVEVGTIVWPTVVETVAEFMGPVVIAVFRIPNVVVTVELLVLELPIAILK
jgi:hypothetical protein